jgi:hypothetical protein
MLLARKNLLENLATEYEEFHPLSCKSQWRIWQTFSEGDTHLQGAEISNDSVINFDMGIKADDVADAWCSILDDLDIDYRLIKRRWNASKGYLIVSLRPFDREDAEKTLQEFLKGNRNK